jgi:hypothetical protein
VLEGWAIPVVPAEVALVSADIVVSEVEVEVDAESETEVVLSPLLHAVNSTVPISKANE